MLYKRLLIISVLLIALVLSSFAAPLAAQDNELVIAVAIEPVSLDAWRGFAETGGPGFLNVVEQLVSRDFATGEIIPVLATSWEQIDDTTIQFQLREGVQFHDGSPFNAEAAATSINYAFDEDNAFDILDFVGGSMSAEAVDEFTLNVFTADPDPTLLNKMYFVVISSAQQLNDDPDSYSTELIGTGPYRFVDWSRGESITYEANPDWWGNDNPDEAGGQISYDTLTFRFLGEEQVRAAAVEAGEVDIAQFVTPDQCAAADDISEIRCESGPSVETIFIRMDTNSPMFSDVRVRRALQLAIDKELIIDTILGGAATVSGQIINETALGTQSSFDALPLRPRRGTQIA